MIGTTVSKYTLDIDGHVFHMDSLDEFFRNNSDSEVLLNSERGEIMALQPGEVFQSDDGAMVSWKITRNDNYFLAIGAKR